ncbi:MAG: AAA family ATPase [Salinivirgaceae bacterium]|nr:AAA family ATPase [Salinivirgaceae bacterium]
MNEVTTEIIILKGAPATGKSQTAKELAKFFPTGVRIEVDNLRSMVIAVDWVNQDEHIRILNVSTQLVKEFLDLNYKPIIVVDTFSGDKINAYYEKLKLLNKDWQISIFGLYATENEIKKRLDLRSNDKFKDFEICIKLNNDTLKFRHEKEIQIDTTNLTDKETSKLIHEKLRTMNTSTQHRV